MTKNGGKFPYTMKQIRKSYWRKNADGNVAVYKFILDTFGVCVTGKSGWKQNAPTKPLSKFFTFTDEAMMLWFLENNYEVWTGDWQYKIGGTLASRKEVPRPLYTKQSKGSDSDGKKRKTTGKDVVVGGWNKDGVKRWNKLCKLVRIGRKKNSRSEFEDSYKSACELQEQRGDRLLKTMEMVGSRRRRNTNSLMCGLTVKDDDDVSDFSDSEDEAGDEDETGGEDDLVDVATNVTAM